ncbi:recombinase RecT [Clostridium sp. K25]|uniref:recombinase RecT n=1 Tax=Clostridium sp. K25 TaxID=1443109 RepID=UPI0004D62580|nr:recombinase RecT [Clostridium sp. K25]KEI06192.1 hypothetical protein Z957_p0172 [Clostridium sp. K25]
MSNVEVIKDNQEIINKEEQLISGSSMGVFSSIKKFEESARMAKALAASTLVPKEYQNNISNCMIAIDTAQRLSVSPFAAMQNLYIVNGRPSWSSQFIISAINTCGRFSEPLNFKLMGEGDGMKCYAYTKDKHGNELKGPTISIDMAKKEGWLSKGMSKWKTMPEVMIRYRAASFFGRLHCPDILMGVYTEDENKEREDSTSIVNISVQDAAQEAKEEIKENANKEKIDIKEESQTVEKEEKVIEVEAEQVEDDDLPY